MLNYIFHQLRNNGKFSKRVKKRYEIFWHDPQAEQIRNARMSRYDSPEKWEDAPFWQRRLSNKYNAREFAAMHGCKVSELYWKGADVENINFAKLPPYYVIRPTIGHSCNNVFVMDNGQNLFDKKYYSGEEIRAILKTEIDKNPDLEFLVEEFLENEEGQHTILTDYKFYCFNGEIACLYVINRLSPKSGYGTFYDEHWNQLEKVQFNYPPSFDQKAPTCFEEMVATAKSLSSLYGIFVRIDLYATKRGCVFGEFTPTPSMGMNFTSYGRKLMINYWDKYCKGLI
jgi:hypothetical protein